MQKNWKRLAKFAALASAVVVMLCGFGGSRGVDILTFDSLNWQSAGFTALSGNDTLAIGASDTSQEFSMGQYRQIWAFFGGKCDSLGFHVEYTVDGSVWSTAFNAAGDTLINGGASAFEQLLYIPLYALQTEQGGTTASSSVQMFPRLRVRVHNWDSATALTVPDIRLIGWRR